MEAATRLNSKALWAFFTVTFGLTIAVALAARLSGLTLAGVPVLYAQLVVTGAFLFPLVGAFVSQKLIAKKPLKELKGARGPWRFYIQAYGIILALYIVNYAITWIFIQKPDLSLTLFINQFSSFLTIPLAPSIIVPIFFLITFVVAPLLNTIPAMGEELGWRGLLLPALEPLGKLWASVLSAIIWALWYTPLILLLGFMYGQNVWPGVLIHFLMMVGFGIWMGYMWFRNRSTVLSAFIHSTFNAHAYGIWAAVFFVRQGQLATVVGPASMIQAALCLILGAFAIYRFFNPTTEKGTL